LSDFIDKIIGKASNNSKEDLNNEIEIAVYNVESEALKIVKIIPSNNWGGMGLIGCEFGSGIYN